MSRNSTNEQLPLEPGGGAERELSQWEAGGLPSLSVHGVPLEKKAALVRHDPKRRREPPATTGGEQDLPPRRFTSQPTSGGPPHPFCTGLRGGGAGPLRFPSGRASDPAPPPTPGPGCQSRQGRGPVARGACWGVRQGRRGEPPWGQPGVVASPSFPGSPLPAAARGVAKDRPLGTRAVGRGLLTDTLVVGRGFSAERGGCKVAPAVGTMGGRPAREGPPPPPLQPLCFFPSAAAALCACLLWQRCLG